MNNSDFQSEDVLESGSHTPANRAKRNAGSSISDSVMTIGRDEMNLAEFPLAGLATRPPKGATSLVFEDDVWDKHGRTRIKRRLTVLPCSEYGLPTASDDEVILGLVQMTYMAGFADRKLTFIPAELFRVLGWRSGGREYARLKKSLRRWVGVTLYYENAWRDNEHKTWMDEHFHLLDNVVIPRDRKRRGKKTRYGRRSPLTIVWNETIFKSFQDGYVRHLDMSILRQLKKPAAKRMYRFLDKRLYKTNRLTFDLRAFACERIGFGRNYDNTHLKRKLNEAIRELEQVGFLKPLPEEQRYRQVRRGEWKVTFIGGTGRKQAEARRSAKSPLKDVLIERGVTEHVAAAIVRKGSHELIRHCVREHDEMLKSGRGSNLGNPPGFLVKNIRKRLESDNTDRHRKCSVRTRPDSTPPRLEFTSSGPARSKEAESDTQNEVIREYLAKLSPEERESLEVEAIESAPPFLEKSYERIRRTGNGRLTEEYRKAIVESFASKALQRKTDTTAEVIR
jgi:hypothetical protein